MIGIINYGSGNVNAIATMHSRLNIPFELVSNSDDLIRCDKLILPGVGDFDETMRLLIGSGLKEALDKSVLIDKIPIIGFCVGMQIMSNRSEEGSGAGFGWIDGEVKKIDKNTLKSKPHLPHMGWNTVKPVVAHPLLDNIVFDKGFYFLHSYYFHCSNPNDTIATTDYGHVFPTVINRENIYGIQFHPEKSHDNGIQIFQNFSQL